MTPKTTAANRELTSRKPPDIRSASTSTQHHVTAAHGPDVSALPTPPARKSNDNSPYAKAPQPAPKNILARASSAPPEARKTVIDIVDDDDDEGDVEMVEPAETRKQSSVRIIAADAESDADRAVWQEEVVLDIRRQASLAQVTCAECGKRSVRVDHTARGRLQWESATPHGCEQTYSRMQVEELFAVSLGRYPQGPVGIVIVAIAPDVPMHGNTGLLDRLPDQMPVPVDSGTKTLLMMVLTLMQQQFDYAMVALRGVGRHAFSRTRERLTALKIDATKIKDMDYVGATTIECVVNADYVAELVSQVESTHSTPTVDTAFDASLPPERHGGNTADQPVKVQALQRFVTRVALYTGSGALRCFYAQRLAKAEERLAQARSEVPDVPSPDVGVAEEQDGAEVEATMASSSAPVPAGPATINQNQTTAWRTPYKPPT
ncbi:hypothetical protein RI367_006519 [Sorochytrium milnesiophthora]